MANIEINYLSENNEYIPLYPQTISSNITDFNSSVNNLVSNYVNVSPKLKANNITDFNSSVNSLISSAEEGKANVLIQKGSYTVTGSGSLMDIQIQFVPDIVLIGSYSVESNIVSNNSGIIILNGIKTPVNNGVVYCACMNRSNQYYWFYNVNIFLYTLNDTQFTINQNLYGFVYWSNNSRKWEDYSKNGNYPFVGDVDFTLLKFQ